MGRLTSEQSQQMFVKYVVFSTTISNWHIGAEVLRASRLAWKTHKNMPQQATNYPGLNKITHSLPLCTFNYCTLNLFGHVRTTTGFPSSQNRAKPVGKCTRTNQPLITPHYLHKI